MNSTQFDVQVKINDLTFRVTGVLTPGGPDEGATVEVGRVFLVDEGREEVFLPRALLGSVYVATPLNPRGNFRLAAADLLEALEAAAAEAAEREEREYQRDAAEDAAYERGRK